MVAVLVALSYMASGDIVVTVTVAMSSFVDGFKSLSGLYSVVSKRYRVRQAVFFFVWVLLSAKPRLGGKKMLACISNVTVCVSCRQQQLVTN